MQYAVAMRLLSLAVTLAALAQAQTPGKGEVVILVGPPGSGKTVHAQKLRKKYKVPAISVAELIERSMKNVGETPAALRASIAGGELLDDAAAIRLIDARVNQPDAGKGFVIDGYPVNEKQAQYLDDFVKRNNLKPPKVVVLSISDDLVRKRLLKRKRADDTPENIERRIREYHQDEKFLESWYKPENTVHVDSSGPVEEVFPKIEAGLIALLDKRKLKIR